MPSNPVEAADLQTNHIQIADKGIGFESNTLQKKSELFKQMSARVQEPGWHFAKKIPEFARAYYRGKRTG